jgi:glycosyltransferase involved in cell wall biosynthesis
MNQSQKSIVVEGWRGINHSFAIVNQFQLLEMHKHTELNLRHEDMPFHYPHWSRATNGAGFHDADDRILGSIAPPLNALPRSWTYRIFSRVDLRPCPLGGRLAVFLVTELGLDEQSFVPGSDIKEFEAGGNIIVAPSRWARDRIVDWGFQPSSVHVVPHAASTDYFYRLPEQTIRSQRAALGFSENEVLLLNIGAAIWNKGIDVLLKSFALARQKRKDIRLIFKDQRNTYGISGDSYIQSTLSSAGLLSDDVIGAITLIPSNLTMDQMNVMYGIADCYVSPYRAEGFNLPVLEAMVCGTPVIVTRGGATEDFIDGELSRSIDAEQFHNAVIQTKEISGYCEPNLEHLVQLILETSPKDLVRIAPIPASGSALGWNSVVDSLLTLMK